MDRRAGPPIQWRMDRTLAFKGRPELPVSFLITNKE